jgi:hypothetical protein
MILPRLQFIFGLWDDEPLPGHYVDNLGAWNRSLPQCVIKIWNSSECHQLLEAHQLDWVRDLRPVQQSDILRLLIVYDAGGWYNDLDTRPLPDAASVWQSYCDDELVLVTESISDAETTRMSCNLRYRDGVPEDPLRIANYSFAATPRDAFLWTCIRLAEKRCKHFPDGQDDYYPIFTTGPDVITTAFHAAQPDSYELIPVGQWCTHGAWGSWRNGRA